jgi:hypothetical protein
MRMPNGCTILWVVRTWTPAIGQIGYCRRFLREKYIENVIHFIRNAVFLSINEMWSRNLRKISRKFLSWKVQIATGLWEELQEKKKKQVSGKTSKKKAGTNLGEGKGTRWMLTKQLSFPSWRMMRIGGGTRRIKG